MRRALGTSKVAKHFRYEISRDRFTFERNEEKIEAEAALDGLYVIRTNVVSEDIGAERRSWRPTRTSRASSRRSAS